MSSARHYDVTFFTATILEWKPLLENEANKEVITESLGHLVMKKKVMVHAFVIMHNHLHLLWHALHPNTKELVQQSLLRFTAQRFVDNMRATDCELLNNYYVGAADRRHQIWERNPLSVSLWTEDLVKQKLNYIHQNPVRKGWCKYAEDYKYSSAAIYMGLPDTWGFVTPIYF